jgi:hypothetical protein
LIFGVVVIERGGPESVEVEVRSAEHLPLDHFDFVDSAFDASGVVFEGQAGADGA